MYSRVHMKQLHRVFRSLVSNVVIHEPARDSNETRLGALGFEKHPPKNLREVG